MRKYLAFYLFACALTCVASQTNSVPQSATPHSGTHLVLSITIDTTTGESRYQLNARKMDRSAVLKTLEKIASINAGQLLQINIEEELPVRELLSFLKDLTVVKWSRIRIDGVIDGQLLDLWRPSGLLPIEE